MSHPISLELSDAAFAVLRRRAESIGTSPAELAASTLECQFVETPPRDDKDAQEARARFERHFGELGPLGPDGLDNEAIDADLAREYADTHEDG